MQPIVGRPTSYSVPVCVSVTRPFILNGETTLLDVSVSTSPLLSPDNHVLPGTHLRCRTGIQRRDGPYLQERLGTVGLG